MSVTFWMPDAPTQRVAPYPDEPDFFVNEPVAPFTEINMATGNACAILALVSPQDLDPEGYDPCGTWDQAALARPSCQSRSGGYALAVYQAKGQGNHP